MDTEAYLEELKQKIVAYNPDCDWSFIEVAFHYAKSAHEGQCRESGEAYIVHPMAVALILTSIQADDSTIIAGLLHDVVEDTAHGFNDIIKDFGPEVTLLVEGVTKLKKLDSRTKSEQKMENMRKLFLAMAMDIRVIIIKLADRLHNMRTLKYINSEQKRREIAQETLDIYTPLANRLGIFQFKWELEDLSLRMLEPGKYFKLVNEIAVTRDKRMEYINEVMEMLREKLEHAGIQCQINGRPKNFYSIFKKMYNQNKELTEIYDLLAVRVIVETIADCYGVLGIVHSLWVPMPGRFKDYIAMPKPNRYQSLHTTIISPNGEPLEVQIRTQEMHNVAEHGIAAHWQYKEGVITGKTDEKLNWLRQMLDWQREVRDADEFFETVKNDLFDETVYVFTPKGDVYDLPQDSVPLDFAYRVHTEVGHKAIGAKVNGRIVTFDYKLRNGDIVEIITGKNGSPSRDWLKLVKTSQAKNRIRNWFRKEKRDENLVKGKEIYERELRKYGDAALGYLKTDKVQEIAKKHHCVNVESFYVGLAESYISLSNVMATIKEEAKLETTPAPPPEVRPFREAKSGSGVSVKGVDNLMVRLGHCCNPLPGDPITGYVTRGKGITVHRADCTSLNAHTDKNRLIEVSWEGEEGSHFQAEIEVEAVNRDRLTIDIMTAIADTKTAINTTYGRAAKNNTAIVNVRIEVKSNEHLEYIMDKIRKIKDVTGVRRVIHGKGHGDANCGS